MAEEHVVQVCAVEQPVARSLLMPPSPGGREEVPALENSLLLLQQQHQNEQQQQQRQAPGWVPWWKRTPRENGFVKQPKAGTGGGGHADVEGGGLLGDGIFCCWRSSQILRHALAVAMVAAAVVGVVACLGFSHPSFHTSASEDEKQRQHQVSRPLSKLNRPVVILISSDGFRWGYNFKVDTPNIERLRLNGTEAEVGLIPVFPTLTFPNHYSIATGLYPAWHGIIANSFRDPDPSSDDMFYQGNVNPNWWLGEPIWESCVKNGLPAATYFWPGSEVVKGPWTCPRDFCQPYNESVPFEERVDTVVGYMDLAPDERPSFISLYFDVPDHPGHSVGPDGPDIDAAVSRIDGMIGRLLDGLEDRQVLEDVTVILVGDHGMVGNCDSRLIYLEDMDVFDDIPDEWLDSMSPLLAISPPPQVDVRSLYQKLSKSLNSTQAENSEYLKIYLKEDLPERFHFSASDRIWPIVGIVAEGYKLLRTRTDDHCCGGSHGYDNALLSMRTIFIASGPRFQRGRRVASFENIQIYNVMASILNISAAPNNGTPSFVDSLLLPVA